LSSVGKSFDPGRVHGTVSQDYSHQPGAWSQRPRYEDRAQQALLVSDLKLWWAQFCIKKVKKFFLWAWYW
jgi:hypothetical protein